ncbi:MAG: M43 family zinc metalloprotease, partial [Bacteroidetes bacterium]|nr:M43 family zinc metalloprotease [Bacteroidota bacterium]
MRNKILLLFLGTLFTTNFGFAQVCGTYEGSLEKDIQKYPHFYQSLESKNAELKLQNEKALSKMTNLKTENGVKIIPVVVHVIHDLGGENISDASIQGALDVLNANINGQGANFLSKTPDVFAAVRGDAKVEFRLAKIDPLGNPTTGINRVRSTLTDQPDPANGVKALSYWNSYQYFNIWTVKKFLPQDDGNTLLGYAQFPNSGRMSTDGVVLLSSQMVSGGTLTHEVGHWLGLRHTWGDAVCGDDGVKDTPPARDPNFGVNLSDFPYHVGLAPPPPITGVWGCIGDSLNWAGEMFVNYMDYSNDADVTMFTIDQNAIMNTTLDGSYDESTGVSGIGFREYMWSDENIAATGTSDGFKVPTCTQEASFVVMNGASSLCQGEALLLKGNQTMFGAGNVSSFVWDFGDGNTDNSGSNFLSHTYNSVGSFDVTLTIVYNETTEA